ncbi:MAG TPA: ABATE domain-containing protein [Chloroflexota bacterium]
MQDDTRADKLEMIGGRLCLDFSNTTGGRETESPNERLTSYRELAAWGRHAGVLDPAAERRLLAEAERRPDEAAAVLREATEVREAIYRIFSASSAGLPVAEADLATINGALSRAMRMARLRRGPDGIGWGWAESEALDQMLWPVVRSAAELLTSTEAQRVRECGGSDCTWLFLDTTKNRSRRWCDMGDCGNRAKARRHYARLKGSHAPA